MLGSIGRMHAYPYIWRGHYKLYNYGNKHAPTKILEIVPTHAPKRILEVVATKHDFRYGVCMYVVGCRKGARRHGVGQALLP